MRRLFVAVLPGGHTVGWEVAATDSNDPFSTDMAPWRLPTLPGDITGIAIGEGRACALGKAVTCWNLEVDPDLQQTTKPSEVAMLSGAVDIAIGDPVSCAHMADGHARCWGSVDYLGNGLSDEIATPVDVAGIDDAVQLSGRSNTMCARRRSGHVACWGAERGSGTPVEVTGIVDAIDLAIASNACARLADGRTACWDVDEGMQATIVPGFAHATAIYDRGDRPVCARIASHFVCPTGPSDDVVRSWAMAHQGVSWACTRRASLPAISCVRTGTGSKEVPAAELGPLADVADLALSRGVVMFVARTSGAVEYHAEDDAKGVFHRIVDIDHVTALVLGPDRDGVDEEVCGLSSNGTVACWPAVASKDRPLHAHAIAGITDATGLAGTASATCVLRKIGKVSCWGRRGALGNGSTAAVTEPVIVEHVAL